MHKRVVFPVVLGTLLLAAPAMAQDPEPPDIVPVPVSIRDRVSTSTEGLREEFALSGMMVRLNGRFQNLVTVTMDETGRPVIQCQKTVPTAGHKLSGSDSSAGE